MQISGLSAPPPSASFAASRLVVTAGRRGSGSTWVFNIVRELLIATRGEANVLGVFAEHRGECPSAALMAGRAVVIKSHSGTRLFDDALIAAQADYILSIRDPRDAAISVHQRFGYPIEAAVILVLNDCRRLARLVAQGYLTLRYEDRFFDNPQTIEQIATRLGLTVSAPIMATIAQRYTSAAIQSFVGTLANLPAERVQITGNDHYDRVTHIHRFHIGDMRSGKWRDWPATDQAHLTTLFMPFLDQFNIAA
jgi:hypothetical protein